MRGGDACRKVQRHRVSRKKKVHRLNAIRIALSPFLILYAKNDVRVVAVIREIAGRFSHSGPKGLRALHFFDDYFPQLTNPVA
jgi:hypothetical protein